MPKPSILIAGAGPVGLTAAIELVRRGVMPRIVDKTQGPAPESRALAIHARSLDILEPSGVTARLLAEGNRVTEVALQESGRLAFTLKLSRLPHRFNFILVIPQSDTEKILAARLRELGGRVEWNTTLTGLSQSDGGAVCRLQSNGGEETLAADIVIGADGAHSLVRDTAGIGFHGESWPNDFGLADVRFADSHAPQRAVADLSGGRVLGFFPLSDREGRYVSNQPDILPLLPTNREIVEIPWQSRFQISFRQVETYRKGRLFLAGDAAHIHSPVGGRGMNLGIEDAATLAWLIAEERTEDYSALRWPVGRAVLEFTERQTRQLTAGGPFAHLLRRYVMPTILSVPGVERFAVSELTGLRTPAPPWLDGG